MAKYYLIRTVVIGKQKIVQKIPLNAKTLKEAYRTAEILNSPENLNPKVFVVEWRIREVKE